jgi:urea carboxylase
VVLPSRIVHLPMAWEEKWTRDAIDKYMRSGRPEAPYLPCNIQ